MEEVLQVKVLQSELEVVLHICNNDPLYVIDNVPVAAGGLMGKKPLTTINQNIESITVLKDACNCYLRFSCF
jgi:hypothetical protein